MADSSGTAQPVALVTGASRGIGAASAMRAAQAGYHVCVNYLHDKQAADNVVDSCTSHGVQAFAQQADVASKAAVQSMFNVCDQRLGAPSLLINNAGIIGQASRLAMLSSEILHETFAVNVYGTIYCSQQAIKRMALSNGGRGGVIINISSIAALQGSPGEYVHYAASKGAVETLTIGLAREVAGEGIRVNAVRAGTTDTQIHQRSGNPDRPALVAASNPMRRVATADEIAAAALWLASQDSAYTNGAILPISGGS